jgi:hypothetical protein
VLGGIEEFEQQSPTNGENLGDSQGNTQMPVRRREWLRGIGGNWGGGHLRNGSSESTTYKRKEFGRSFVFGTTVKTDRTNGVFLMPPPTKKHVLMACVAFFVMLPASLPLGLMIYAFSNLELSELQSFVLAVYLVLIIALIFLGVALIAVTNTDSISGMVAQRYNVISYLTIVVIVAISFFSSCFVVAGGIARELQNYDVDRTMVLLGAISPLLTCMILVAPIVVSKTAEELKMTPDTDYRINFFCIECAPFVRAEPIQQDSPQRYTLYFFPCFSSNIHTVLHFLAVGSGLALGYASSIMYMSTREYSPSYKWQVGFLVTSAVCCAIFIAAGAFQELSDLKDNHELRRFVFWIEYIGLYFYMITLIYNSILSGNLLTGGDVY